MAAKNSPKGLWEIFPTSLSFLPKLFQKIIAGCLFALLEGSKKMKNTPLSFISLSDSKAFNEIENATPNTILYIINYQTLKKADKKDFCKLIEGKKAIILMYVTRL